jgi:hypothetical protein
MTKKGQIFQKVPLKVKLHNMKLYFDEGRSAHTLVRVFELAIDTIYTCVRIYKRDGGG